MDKLLGLLKPCYDSQTLTLRSLIAIFTNDVAFQKNSGVIVVLQIFSKILLHQCIVHSITRASLDSFTSQWASVAPMELCEIAAHCTSSSV